jgi:hypothetical protein
MSGLTSRALAAMPALCAPGARGLRSRWSGHPRTAQRQPESLADVGAAAASATARDCHRSTTRAQGIAAPPPSPRSLAIDGCHLNALSTLLSFLTASHPLPLKPSNSAAAKVEIPRETRRGSASKKSHAARASDTACAAHNTKRQLTGVHAATKGRARVPREERNSRYLDKQAFAQMRDPKPHETTLPCHAMCAHHLLPSARLRAHAPA